MNPNRILAATLFSLILFAIFAAAQVSAQGLSAPVNYWRQEWPKTDFTRHSVPLSEIQSGGPPKDGIPPIDNPKFVSIADAAKWVGATEPVMVFSHAGDVRAYPLQILMFHEIVNDVAGDVPVAVTFCPLCNSGLIFDRRLGGRVLEFGVSGMLRFSDMVMFDRQTDSWWQQFQGRAIVGELQGLELTALPAWLESWQGYLGRNPDGLVMAEPKGHRRNYGSNPYAGYDSGRPFLYQGENPPHGIDPVARVVRVGNRAWPLIRLAEAGEITEAGYRLSWAEGQASALDTRAIGQGREVGDVRVYDAATGAGVIHEVVFAFAFHAFYPDAPIHTE